MCITCIYDYCINMYFDVGYTAAFGQAIQIYTTEFHKCIRLYITIFTFI